MAKVTLLRRQAIRAVLPALRGSLAYNDMDSLSTKLGTVAIAISAKPKANQADAIAALAVRQLTFHKAPAMAFKKGSGRTREDAYSDALRDDVCAAVRDALTPYFDNVKVEGSRYVRPESAVEQERRSLYASLTGIVPAAELAKLFPEFSGNGTAGIPAVEAEAEVG